MSCGTVGVVSFSSSLWITAGMLKCCRLTEDAGTYCILWLALFALASIAESVSHYYVFSSQTINTHHSHSTLISKEAIVQMFKYCIFTIPMTQMQHIVMETLPAVATQ